jgi:hypothetical protein
MRGRRGELHNGLPSGIAATRIGDRLAPRDVDDAVYEGMRLDCARDAGRATNAEAVTTSPQGA